MPERTVFFTVMGAWKYRFARGCRIVVQDVSGGGYGNVAIGRGDQRYGDSYSKDFEILCFFTRS